MTTTRTNEASITTIITTITIITIATTAITTITITVTTEIIMEIHKHGHRKEETNTRILEPVATTVVLTLEWKEEEEDTTPRHAIKLKLKIIIIHLAIDSLHLDLIADPAITKTKTIATPIGKIQRGNRRSIQPSKYTLQLPK
jgi:hypothetical protein